jgi:hypothetical protein
MSIIDTLMGAVEQHPELNQEQHSNLVQTAMQMFGNHAGLSGLMNNAESQGIGQHLPVLGEYWNESTYRAAAGARTGWTRQN